MSPILPDSPPDSPRCPRYSSRFGVNRRLWSMVGLLHKCLRSCRVCGLEAEPAMGGWKRIVRVKHEDVKLLDQVLEVCLGALLRRVSRVGADFRTVLSTSPKGTRTVIPTG